MGDKYTNPPQSRNEAILRATIDGTEYTAPPQSRIEDLLLELKEAIEEGGGSVESYEQLTSKPQINGTTLSGNKTTEDLIPIGDGLQINADGELETADAYIPTSEKGTASGVATLTEAGKVPEAQLPSYVDDAIEGYLYEGHFYADSAHTEEITGERGKIYVDLDTNRAYRWTGSTFVEIGDNNTFTANRALVSDANGKVSASSATSEEVGYLSGVTGAIQTQLDGKADENEATPVSVSGNPITITDAANIPCESLSMTIEPIQSGSGTPSPTNVRPISGLMEANVLTHGKNYFDDSNMGATSWNKYNIPNLLKPNTTYRFTVFNQTTFKWKLLASTTNGSTPSSYIALTDYLGLYGANFTTPSNLSDYPYLLLQGNASGAGTAEAQFDITDGTTAIGEHIPYESNSVKIEFGETVYGGNVDFESGIVTVTHANIASYNGETINEPWISSMDEYVSGATPTTGAQVVYQLTTPTTLTLTPAQLTLLKGYNTVSANGATINLDYQKDNLAGDIKKWVIEHFG